MTVSAAPLEDTGVLAERGGGETLHDDRRVELLFPATPELRRVARLVVSSIGANAGFDVEEIADLRLASDELCMVVALGGTDRSQLKLVVRWSERSIEVACSGTDVGKPESPSVPVDQRLPGGLDPSELSERILEALVDEYEIEAGDGRTRHGWFRQTR